MRNIDSSTTIHRDRANSGSFGTVAAWASIAVIFAADCFTQLNLSILYALPLVAIGRTLTGKRLTVLTVALLATTLLGYVIKTCVVLTGRAPPLLSYRLLNRALVVSILILTSVVLRLLYRRTLAERRRDDFDHLLESLTPLLIVLLVFVVTVAILAADLIAPGEYNLPILYGLPIVLIAAARSQRLMWGSVLILSVFSMAGYFVGPPPQVAPTFQKWTLVNRVVAVFAVIGLAALLRSGKTGRHPKEVELSNPLPP